MSQAALARFEQRLIERAPDLVAEFREMVGLARPEPLSTSMEATWMAVEEEDPVGADGPSMAPSIPVAGRARYADLGLLGRGGMGEVRRVRDVELKRVVALKQIRSDVIGPAMVSRFIAEFQTTAQLQHPGIVPVYDAGQLTDGRLYFTMKEVKGRELSKVIRAVHEVSPHGWEQTADGWSLRRLVTSLLRASEAVAFAHERGVLHRDLKPSNVMVGAHGEVLVMDWGIARLRGPAPEADAADADRVQVDRSRAATRSGRVMGTPAYMSPEQALGDNARLSERADLYSLGAILYEILAGAPPYEAPSSDAVLALLLAGPPRPLDRVVEAGSTAPGVRPLPEELVAVCERAMAQDPADRYPSAQAFAAALEAWLDGSRRREQALALIERAGERGPAAEHLRQRAQALRAEAAATLRAVHGWQPEEDKAEAWAKEDEASALEDEAHRLDFEQESLLRSSLSHAPELPEAHAALAERHRAEHAAHEAATADASRSEALLRQHLAALPGAHPARRAGEVYLRGDGALTLVTDPPGAQVALYRFRTERRRLVEVFERDLGPTPLRAVSLPMGSWVCVLRCPGRAEVRYPVFIGRGEHWDGVPPEGGEPLPIHLPRSDGLGPDDCYVPAGWFWSGGDRAAPGSLPRRRLWVDAHVFRRFPTTNRQFIAFLDARVAEGREGEALRHAPRERGGTVGELGACIYGYDGSRFHLRPDADGDLWEPENPVLMVDWPGALAFAAWESERTGQAWTLPGEYAWEKAARGVDGRAYPWGAWSDPSWACYGSSHQGRPMPSVVDRFPVDRSVYGVRGMGGNCRDWCADIWRPDGARVEGARVPGPECALDDVASLRVERGGSWGLASTYARVGFRNRTAPSDRRGDLGFRLARAYVPR